jgi:hypothetical protein
MVLYYCVLIVFSLHRESLKLILATDPLLRWFCHSQGSFTMPWTSSRRDSCGPGVKNCTGANVKSIGFEYVDPCSMEGLASLIWGGLGEL